jgi:Ca2+-binding EF-hand superfamily protein
MDAVKRGIKESISCFFYKSTGLIKENRLGSVYEFPIDLTRRENEKMREAGFEMGITP